MRRNILFLESALNLGGAEIVTSNLITMLDRNRFKCTVCTFYDGGPIGRWLSDHGYQVYENIAKCRYDPGTLMRLRTIILKNRIDLIYLINQPLTLFWGLLVGKLCGIPVIAAIHNTFIIRTFSKLQIYRVLLPCVNRIIAVAEKQRRHVISQIHVKPSQVEVIYNGIDISRFPEIDCDLICASNDLPISHPIVGLVARLVYLKGVDVFCRCAGILMEKDPTISYVIIGDGPEKEKLERLVDSLKLPSKVTFLGERQDVHTLIKKFDIAVLPSRSEAFPISILEFMAASKCVIASDVGSIREAIEPGVTGFLVPPDDADELSARIMYCLHNPDIRYRMGENARRVVVERFSLANTVAKTEAVLDNLL